MGKSPAKWIKTVLFGKKSSKPNISKGRERFVNEKEVVVAARVATTEFVADPLVAFHESTNTTDNNKGLELETRKLQVHLVIESQEAKVQIHKALHYKMQRMILKKSGKSKLQQRHRLPLEVLWMVGMERLGESFIRKVGLVNKERSKTRRVELPAKDVI